MRKLDLKSLLRKRRENAAAGRGKEFRNKRKKTKIRKRRKKTRCRNRLKKTRSRKKRKKIRSRENIRRN